MKRDGGLLGAAMLISVLAINGLASTISASFDGPIDGAMVALAGVSAVVWFALFALFRIALDGGSSGELVPAQDRLVFFAALVLAMVPIKEAAFAGLLGLAVFLIITSRPGSARRRIALIAAALSGPVIWGPMFRAFFGPELTGLEALVLSGLPGLGIEGNVISAIDGTTRFVVAGTCSAIANVSLALLLTVTMAQLAGIRKLRLVAVWSVLAILSVVIVNSARLAALGYYPGHFEYLHEGPGRDLFVNAAFALMTVIAIAGTLHAARRQA